MEKKNYMITAEESIKCVTSFRKKYGLSQGQLGKLIGVSQRTIANYECGFTVIPRFLYLFINELMNSESMFKRIFGKEIKK